MPKLGSKNGKLISVDGKLSPCCACGPACQGITRTLVPNYARPGGIAVPSGWYHPVVRFAADNAFWGSPNVAMRVSLGPTAHTGSATTTGVNIVEFGLFRPNIGFDYDAQPHTILLEIWPSGTVGVGTKSECQFPLNKADFVDNAPALIGEATTTSGSAANTKPSMFWTCLSSNAGIWFLNRPFGLAGSQSNPPNWANGQTREIAPKVWVNTDLGGGARTIRWASRIRISDGFEDGLRHYATDNPSGSSFFQLLDEVLQSVGSSDFNNSVTNPLLFNYSRSNPANPCNQTVNMPRATVSAVSSPPVFCGIAPDNISFRLLRTDGYSREVIVTKGNRWSPLPST